MDLSTLWANFIEAYGMYLLGLVILVAADFLMGLGAALKQKKFDWAVLANFYRTNVIPKIVGWVALVIVSYAVTGPVSKILGPVAAGYFGPGMANVSYLALAGTMLASIYSNYQEISAPSPVVAPVVVAIPAPEKKEG